MAIIYQIGFKADVKTLAGDLSIIERDIQRTFNQKATSGLNLGLQQGIQSAKLLQSTLQKATTDKGVSFVQMNAELRKANQTTASMVSSLSGAGMKQSLNLFLETFANADRSILSLNAKLAEMQRVLMQSFKFTAAQGAFRFIQTSLQASISFVRELDSDMNQISIVTGKNADQMERVSEQALKASRQLRVAATEYAQASLIFYQQGLDDGEVERRTDITIKAAKAAGESVTQMSEELTAVWNTYKMQGEQLESAADVAAKLGAETAVDFKYIAEAMQSAALPAAQLGVEYEQLASIIATVGETTMQSASVIGNAYKTILARFANLKAGGKEGEVELGRIAVQLDTLGVKILDSDDNLRDMGEVLNEVGNSWSSYSEKQQIALAQTLGGIRQYGQLLALMQNFDKYQKNLDIAENQSDNTLEEQYLTSLETIDSAMVNSAEAWRRAFAEVFESENQITFYNALETTGGAVEGLVEGFGGLKGILVFVGAILAKQVVGSLKNAVGFSKDLVNNMTLSGQKKDINKNFNLMSQASITNLGPNPSQAAKNDDLVLQNKLKVSKDIAIANVDLNRMIQIGNGEQKLRAQMLQEELSLRQKNINVMTDEAQRLTTLIQREADRANALGLRAGRDQDNEGAYGAQGRAAIATGIADLTRTAAQTGTIDEVALEKLKQQLENARKAYVELHKVATSDTMRSGARKMETAVSAALESIGDDAEAAMLALQNLSDEISQIGEDTDLPGMSDLGESMGEALEGTDALNRESQRLSEGLDQAGSSVQGMRLGAEAGAQGMLNLAASLTMVNFGVQGMVTAWQDGDFMAGLGSVVMLGPGLLQVASAIGTLTGATNLLNTTQGAGLTISQTMSILRKREASEIGILNALSVSSVGAQNQENIATALGVTTTELDTKAMIENAIATRIAAGASKEDAAAEVLQILTTNSLTTSIVANTKAVLAQTVALLASPWTWLVLAIVAVIGVIITLTAVNKAAAKAAKEHAEDLRELSAETQALTESIEQNTDSVKKNEAAWIAVRQAGKDASSEYDALRESLNDLNDDLIKASGNQDYLNKLMTKGLNSRDLSEYYAEAEKIQNDNLIKGLEQGATAQAAQLEATKRQMIADGDTNSSGEESLSKDDKRDVSDRTDVDQHSERLKEIVEEYDVFQKENGNIKIKIDFDDPKKFRDQYEQLVDARKDMEKVFTSEELKDNSAYEQIGEQIKSMGEAYGIVEEQVTNASDSIRSLMGDPIKSMDFSDTSLTFEIESLEKYKQSIYDMGIASGLSEEEVDSLYRSIIAMNPELNRSLEMSDKLSVIKEKMAKASGVQNTDSDVYQKELDRLATEKASYDELLKTANNMQEKEGLEYINPKWIWGKSAKQKKDEKIQETNDLLAANDKLIKETQRQADELKKIEDEMDAGIANLSDEDQEVLLKIEVDNADNFDELADKIDAYKDVTLRLKVEVTRDENAEIDKINEFQSNIGAAIGEYQADGNSLSLDTVQKLLALGPEYKNYLMEINGRYVLTQEAIDKYNQSLINEKEYTTDLINATVKPNEALKSLAYSMADLSAVADDSNLEAFSKKISDLSIDFANGEINSESFFNSVDKSVEDIGTKLEGLSLSDYLNFSVGLGDTSIAISDYIAQLKSAFEAGEISSAEYMTSMSQAASSMLDLGKATEKTLKAEAKSRGAIVEEIGKGEEKVYKVTGLAADEAEKLENSLNDAAKNTKKLQKEIDGLSGFSGIAQAFEDNYSELEKVFNNDFTFKIDFETNTDQAMSAINGFLSQASENFDALTDEQQAAVENAVKQNVIAQETAVGITAESAKKTADIAFEALKTGSMTAANATSHATVALSAISTEAQTAITSSAGAMAEVMGGISDLVSGFDAGIEARPTTDQIFLELPSLKDIGAALKEKGNTRLPFSLSGGLGLNITGSGGEKTSAAVSRIQNGMNFLTSQGGGATGGLDFFGNNDAGSVPGDPGSILDEKGGKGGKKGGGGGGSKSNEVTGELKQFAERFRDIDDSLAEIDRRLDKVSAATDNAFGKNKLRLLAETNLLYQKQGKLLKDLEAEARRYMTGSGGVPTELGEEFLIGNDQDVLKKMTSILNLGEITFDPDGFVSNVEEIQRAGDNYLKSIIEQQGVLNKDTGLYSFGTGDAAEAKLKAYEDEEKKLDQLYAKIEENNSAAEKADNAKIQRLEVIHNWLSDKIAEADLKLELKIKVNDMDLRQLEFLIDRLGDKAKNISLDYLDESVTKVLNKGKALIDNYARLDEIIRNINTTSGEGAQYQDYFEKTFGEGSWGKFLENGGAYTEEMLNNLADKAEDMQAIIEGFYDYSEQIFGSFREALDIYLGDFDNLISRFDDSSTELDAWAELWDVAGNSVKNSRMHIELMGKSIDTQTSKIKSMQEQYGFLKGQLENAEKVYRAAQAAHGDDDRITQDALQSWKDLQNQVNSTGASIKTEIGALARQFEEKAAAMAETIRKEFNSALGGLAADLQGMGDMFSQKDAMDKFFMHEEDLGAELGDLMQQVMDDPEALKDAAKWEEYLGDLIEKKTVETQILGEMREHEVWVAKDGVELTEKQLQIIKEQFELEKEQAALADKQAAKNTMRLARDSSGNWSYNYSDDRSESEDQAKDIEDRLANIRKLHREAVDELTDFWLDEMGKWEDFEANVDQKRYEQDEKYRAQVDQQRAWYKEMMQTLSNQIEGHLGDIDMSFDETTWGTISNLGSMGEANNVYTENIENMSNAFRESWKENQQQLESRLEEMGMDMDNFEDIVREETDQIIKKNEENEKSVKDLNKTATKELNSMTTKIQNWSNRWQTEIQNIINKLRTLIETIRELTASESSSDTDWSAKLGDEIEKENQANHGGENSAASYEAIRDSDIVKSIWRDRQDKLDFMSDEDRRKVVSNEELERLIMNSGLGWDAVERAWVIWDAAQHKRRKVDLVAYADPSNTNKNIKDFMMNTGGYVTEPTRAIIGEKKPEIVLNPADTENFLQAISIMRESIASHLNNIGVRQANTISAAQPQPSVAPVSETPVIIQADFPNVTARDEIEAAFSNLVNQAAQYKMKPRN